MFADLTYMHIYDNEFDDEEANEDHSKKPWVVGMCNLWDQMILPPMWKKKKITTNLQVHPLPEKKMLVQMGT